MPPDWQMLLMALGLVLVVVFILWLVSVKLHDTSIADPWWGMGFVLLAWTAFFYHSASASRPLLVSVLTSLWGLRLTLYLTWRNWGRGEDYRYATMRRYHGRSYWWISLFTVFILQGILLWIVALPILMTAGTPLRSMWNAWDIAGALVWTCGMFFETVADWQLTRFKSDPTNRGKVLRQGLWRYTRHPNYFGDFCVWWGIYLIAVAGGAWWTIISPLTMSVLLMWVSGVRLLETTIQDRRPEYAEYCRTTNAFFPWFPESTKHRSET